MPILIAIVLGIAALTFVLFPLYRSVFTKAPRILASQTTTSTNGAEGVAGMRTEREQSARIALQEIELDYQLGNISETDYNTLRERYMRRVLAALKSRHERDQQEDGQDLDELIEEQLRKMKENGNDATE